MQWSQLFSFAKNDRSGAQRVVGVDIGSSAIKVVELENRGGVITLTTYGETQLGPYDAKEVGQSVVLTPEKEQQALVDVLRESSVKARQSVMAMPLSASFVTVMSLTGSPEEDLGPRIRVEARKYIPAQINEVTLDWAEVASAAGTDVRDVLVAAIQNDALKRFTDLTTFVGFPTPPTEIECFSAIRAVYRANEAHIAIVDVGATASKLYLTRSGLLQRMHRVRAGGSLATRRIAELLDVDFESAERTKRLLDDTARAEEIVRAHDTIYEQPFEEFRQVLAAYEADHNLTIERIYLAGGGALFSSVPALAARVLGKEVVLAQPFTKVAYPAFMEDLLTVIGPTFTPALGAALRAFE
jgi:type IV pilus assembly protein PilM